MDGRCATCKWWVGKSESTSAQDCPPHMKLCAINDEATSQDRSRLSRVLTWEDVVLATAADFGCVQWESRDELDGVPIQTNAEVVTFHWRGLAWGHPARSEDDYDTIEAALMAAEFQEEEGISGCHEVWNSAGEMVLNRDQTASAQIALCQSNG